MNDISHSVSDHSDCFLFYGRDTFVYEAQYNIRTGCWYVMDVFLDVFEYDVVIFKC